MDSSNDAFFGYRRVRLSKLKCMPDDSLQAVESVPLKENSTIVPVLPRSNLIGIGD